MPALAKKIVKTAVKLGVLTVASITALVAASNAVGAWETLQVNGGIALNTNNNFARLDGYPVMSSWSHNINDFDQQFERISGARGGALLRHRSTGKCLNAHYMWNGANLNVWNCNANDIDQNWDVIGVGNGQSLLRRTGTNYCVDSPYRQNGGKIHMWSCDSNNANQRWQSTTVGTVTPQPPTNGPYYRNFEAFIRFAVGQVGIARLDRSDLKGQCVTLVARYIQEVYLTGSQRTQVVAFGNGRDTANVVASRFSQYFLPTTNQGLPKRGAIVSFPGIGYVAGVGCPNNYCGHTAIVMESRTLNGQRQIRIMDSNGDSKNANSKVTEYYSRWINIPNGTANGYGNNIYWTNPR